MIARKNIFTNIYLILFTFQLAGCLNVLVPDSEKKTDGGFSPGVSQPSSSGPFTIDLPFTSITTPPYTTLYTSSSWTNMEFAGDLVRLTPTVQTDDAATTGTMNAGTGSGVVIGTLTDGVNSGLKLGDGGGCNGGSADCAKQTAAEIYELSSSWTPQWNNIVGYWKLNGSGAISNGATIASTVGSSLTASDNDSSLTYNDTGKIGGSIGFSGVNDTLKVTTPLSGKTNNYALSAWFKTTSGVPQTTEAGIISSGGNETWGGSTGITVAVMASGNYWIQKNGIIGYDSGVANTNDIWHFAVVNIHSDNTMTLYIDGQLKYTSANHAPIATGSHLWIANDGSLRYFKGSVDEAVAWNTTLTASEIQTIYERQKSTYSGAFTSRIMNAKSNSSWTTLSWVPTLPFLKELPDYSGGAVQNETSADYSALVGSTGSTGNNDLMSGIQALWHLNETTTGTAPGGKDFKDDSGNGNHGQIGGTVTMGKSGALSNAVEMLPNSNFINFSTVNFTSTAYTVSWWLYPYECTSFKQTIQTVSTAFAFSMTSDCSAYAGPQDGTRMTPTDVPSGTFKVNEWQHIVYTVTTAGLGSLYSNGVLIVSKSGMSAPPAWGGFTTNNNSNTISGLLDEMAIWSRSLDVKEIKQLYQRGASRLKYQVRTCNDNACSGESWQGPDGTSGTYFSELNNNTSPSTGTGDVKATLPSMLFSNFSSAPGNNQYFQYRTILESATSTAALMPELKSTTVDPIHYPRFLSTDIAPGNTIIGMNGVAFYEINAFTQSLGAGGCSNGVVYNLGLSNTGPWKYWTGVTWATADGSSAQANTAAVLVASSNAALTAFALDVGRGSVFFKAFLTSDGTTRCELDNINVGGNR